MGAIAELRPRAGIDTQVIKNRRTFRNPENVKPSRDREGDPKSQHIRLLKPLPIPLPPPLHHSPHENWYRDKRTSLHSKLRQKKFTGSPIVALSVGASAPKLV